MTSFAIRPYAPSDFAAMSDLWVASWVATLPQIDFEARRPWFADHFATLTGAGAECHVAQEEASGAVAGFVIIDPLDGFLDQLAVNPDFWGTDVAEALMTAAKRRAPGTISLDVNQENPRAVRFYEKQGLKIVSEGENPLSGRRTYRMVWRRDA